MPGCCVPPWSTRSTPTPQPTRCAGSPPGTGATTSTAASTRRRRRPRSPPTAAHGPTQSNRRWCWSTRPLRRRRPQLPRATAYVAEQRSRSTGGSDRTVGTYRELTPKGVVRSLHRWVAAAAEMSTGADRWNEAKLLAGLVRLGLLPIVCVVASPPPAAPARRRPRAWRRRRTWRRPPNDPNGKLEEALAVPPVECVQHLHAVLGDGRLVGVQSRAKFPRRRRASAAPRWDRRGR